VVSLALLLTQVVATALGAPQAKASQTPPVFQLAPAEAARLDKILVAWQQASGRVKTFEAGFTRFEYDRVFGNPDPPKTTEKGEVKFTSPNRGLFSMDGTQPEKWLCDGKTLSGGHNGLNNGQAHWLNGHWPAFSSRIFSVFLNSPRFMFSPLSSAVGLKSSAHHEFRPV
jgi:hypothetical protein